MRGEELREDKERCWEKKRGSWRMGVEGRSKI